MIAFLGLGAMGAPMAGRLLDAGNELRVWNRTPGRDADLVARGAHRAGTPAEAVRGASIVITMLADPPALEQVLFGLDGAAATIEPKATLVEMSTVGPAAIRDAAQRLRPVEVLDAPVLGSVPHAQSGTLVILVGGERHVLDRCDKVLATMGTVHHVGPSGAGAMVKLANNAAGMSAMVGLGEVLALTDRAGFDPAVVLDAIGMGPLASFVDRWRDKLTGAVRRVDFRLTLARKDLALALDEGRAAGVVLSTVEAAVARCDEAIAVGRADEDNTAVVADIRTPERASRASPPRELARRFLPVVIGARVGDAMGAPTEGLGYLEIAERFGWVEDFTGDGTDDSLMASLLADALLASDGNAGADEWAAQWVRQRDRMMAKRDRFFPSVLHTAEKLAYGLPPRRVAAGTMPSSSSAMAIWPVGLVNAGDPRAAATQAYSIAALIHVDEVDFCQDAAAAVAAAVAAGLRPDGGVDAAISQALHALHPTSGAEMRDLISEAVAEAREASGYEAFRERYLSRFGREIACDSRETVPAAFALAVLAGGDLRRGVELAANFGRDTDTIATMTGALCGAIGGPNAVPEAWVAALGAEALRDAEDLAGRLAELARAKVMDRRRVAQTIPGLAYG